jgi:hypothetical protein
MPDPAASAAAAASANAIAVGTVTITGSFLGLQYDLLLVGIAGGLVALSMMPQTSRIKMALTVITSAIVAGYGGPLAAAWAADTFVWATKTGDALRWFSAFAVGVSAQTIVPVGLRFLANLGNRFGGSPQ